MKLLKSFASDNNAGVHPAIMQAIAEANSGHTIGYGDDPYTAGAMEKFRQIFGNQIDVFFVFNGTAANVLGLKSVTDSFNSIICSELAHLNVDECGAPEKFTGCKLLTVPTTDGKISIDGIQRHLHGFGFEHHAQPRVVSITQSTEMGTVYSPEEIRAIADFVHRNGLLLHMDGARLSNAAAALKVDFSSITRDAGVDVLSFGGTKNGMMLGEAIVFFNRSLSENFKYYRKQGMQLGSKMRFISAQFIAYLSDDLWLKTATHANMMAQKLAAQLKNIPDVHITQKVESNAVFARIPARVIPLLQDAYFFYVWDESNSEVRWMTSFDTTDEDVDSFVKKVKEVLKA